MTTSGKSVFISYRRSSSKWIALTLFKELRARGYDVFWDIDSIGPGRFAEIILSQISARTHFVLLLAHGTLDRFDEDDDWVRREIRHALETRRHIIPVEIENFNLDDVRDRLPNDIQGVLAFTRAKILYEFYDESIEKLVSKYLIPREDVIVTPPTPEAEQVAADIVKETDAMPTPTRDQLAQELYYQNNIWNPKVYDNPDEIIAAYTTVITLDPGHVEAYVNRAMAHYSKRDFERALVDIERALSMNPNHARAHGTKAIVFAVQGKYAEAVEHYNRTLEIDPTHLKALNNRALAYQVLGNYAKALEDFNSVLQQDPEYYEAYNNRGMLKFLMKNPEGALEDFAEVLKRQPNFLATYINRAATYDVLGRYDEALTDLDFAVTLNPNVAPLHNNRGEVLYSLQRFEDALTAFNHSINVQPGYTDAQIGLALTHDALGQTQEAERWWKALLMSDERFKDAEWVIEQFHQTESRHEAIRQLIARVVKDSP
ncbi:MAG: hypothetical protein OHK0046_28090 [Anaerolineae bacterium]